MDTEGSLRTDKGDELNNKKDHFCCFFFRSKCEEKFRADDETTTGCV